MSLVENFTFEEISIGQTASLSRSVTEEDIRRFATVSSDVNPMHLDEAFAQTTKFKGRIAHGMFTAGLISAVIGVQLPGPGAIYLSQNLRFERPVRLGDTISVELKVLAKTAEKNIVELATTARNQLGKIVVSGTATVLAPTEKYRGERITVSR